MKTAILFVSFSDRLNRFFSMWGRMESCGGLATRQLRRNATGAQLAKLPHK